MVPSGATVTLTLPDGQSHVRRAEIALPVGTTLSPGVANGLVACTAAQFAATAARTPRRSARSASSRPLIGTLGGKVFFGDGFRLYVIVAGQRRAGQLPGDVHLDPATGQITTIFDDLPQVPFTSFSLTLPGRGERGARQPVGVRTSNSRRPDAVERDPAEDGHRELHDRRRRARRSLHRGGVRPGLRVAATSTAAGRPAGAVTLEVSRSDGSQDLSRVTTELPPGLAGSLKGVPVCADAAADAGTCPADTRLGSVSALAGSGDAPVR